MSSSPVQFSIAPLPARDVYRDRQPPWSEDAEQAVISAMLMDGDAILRATEFVDDSMFYKESHRRIVRAIIAIADRGDVVDPLTLSDELGRRNELDQAGGKEYIGFLVDTVPTSANIEYHAKIVREKALRRRLIETSTAIISEAYDSPLAAPELIDEAEHRMFQVSQSRGQEGFVRIKELLWPAMERIEKLQAAEGAITGVPSGFKDLDELTTGFQKSDLVIIAGRPSMGKTAFILNIVQNAALEHRIPVCLFSLEMNKESVVQRMLTSEGMVDAQRLRKGRLHDEEYVRLGRAAGVLSQAPIWIDDTPAITLLELRSKARRMRMEHSVEVIIVDYLQLIAGPSHMENRQQEISLISRSLKSLARELQVPVVALSQLSRAPEQRSGEHKRPQLSDLRESGAIEQDADVVMFIYRPELYEAQMDKLPGEGKANIEGLAEIIVSKQRNGPTGTVKLFFQKTFTRFESYTARQPT